MSSPPPSDPILLSAAEQALVEAIDPAAVQADLAALVAIPSVGGTRAEADAQDWVAERLRDLGADVDWWATEVSELEQQPGWPGMEVDRRDVVGCVGVVGGTAEPCSAPVALAFCGHTDVVPPGDLGLWGGDPFRLRTTGGRAIGRGTCDMKGGVAAVLAVLRALQATGTAPARPLAVHAVAGEEDGGAGAFATLARGHRAEACVIAEPTEGAVVPANAGSLTFRLEVAGLAAHGAARTKGVSAVDLFTLVNQRLRTLETERNALRDSASGADLFAHLDVPWPLSVGRVQAGDWASTVPDRLVAEGRYGVRPGESLESARAELEVAVADVRDESGWLATHPVTVTWPGGVFAPGALTPGDPLLADAVGAVRSLGFPEPPVRGAPYGSDLRHYAAAGIPTLQLGPGELDQAHAVDESVELADVVRCARAYAVLAARRCGIA